LFYGATSLGQTFAGWPMPRLPSLNPVLVNPLLIGILRPLAPFLIPLLFAATLAYLAVWLTGPKSPEARPLVRFAAVLAGALFVSLAVHRLAYHYFRLLLPNGRTAIYVIPAVILTIGAIASIPSAWRIAALSRNALIAMLCALACWNLLCLRLEYFYEWRYQQDVQAAYDVVAWYNRNRGIRGRGSQLAVPRCHEFLPPARESRHPVSVHQRETAPSGPPDVRTRSPRGAAVRGSRTLDRGLSRRGNRPGHCGPPVAGRVPGF